MNKLWLIARANIRKSKSVSVTLAIMFVIAALLLNTGLLVVFNYGGFFNELKEELKPSDAYMMIPGGLNDEKTVKYFEDSKYVTEYFSEESLILGADIRSKSKNKSKKDKEESYTVLFFNMENDREKSKWKKVGESDFSEKSEIRDIIDKAEFPVYLPGVFNSVNGYKAGDSMTLKYSDIETREDKELTVTVAGFSEDIFFSSTDTGLMGFYLSDEVYKKVSGILDHPNHKEFIYFLELDKMTSLTKVDDGMREFLGIEASSVMGGDVAEMLFSIDVELIEMSRTMMATMVSMMMVVFALIIVTVCLLVVRFRIVNTIEDDMMKIGSLKSIGYTSKQVITSILAQFLLIGGIGSIIGIAFSYPVLPGISLIFEQQSGLRWEQGFDGIVSSAAFAILMLIVTAVSLIAARNVNRLSPINALRGESAAHGYKRNRLPLEKAKGNLSFTLAIKSVVQNMKLSATIAVIVAGVAFAGAYGLIMYYNTSVDTTAFAEIPGMEITNVIATIKDGNAEVVNEISNMENVRKTLFHDEVKLKIDDIAVTSYIMDDFSTKNTKLVYEGRYPKHGADNEIVLAGILAGRIDKEVGDTVTVAVGDNTEEFKVVGLSNGSQMGGMNSCINYADYKRMNPDFIQQNLYVYFKKESDEKATAAFIAKLIDKYDKEILISTTNFDKMMAEGMASYQNIVAVMGLAMLIITILVVTLVLYFVISSSIIRRKRELGIQKAIGYTTVSLMNQLAIGFVLPVFCGSAVGSLLGAFCTNPMMTVIMKGMGIMKASFIVDPVWVLLFGAGVIVFSYLLSILVTLRIRKISAYALVTE